MRPRYIVSATWTPPGARMVDSLRLTLYTGDVGGMASDAEDWILAWARESTCGGSLLIETTEDGKPVAWLNRSIQHGDALPGVQPTGGYPAHACGKPMVPADVVGAGVKVPTGCLFCLGCLRAVGAPAADRLRAQVAASVERKARAS